MVSVQSTAMYIHVGHFCLLLKDMMKVPHDMHKLAVVDVQHAAHALQHVYTRQTGTVAASGCCRRGLKECSVCSHLASVPAAAAVTCTCAVVPCCRAHWFGCSAAVTHGRGMRQGSHTVHTTLLVGIRVLQLLQQVDHGCTFCRRLLHSSLITSFQ